MRHGAGAYRRGYCRCRVCKGDHAARTLRERQARRRRLAADPSLAPHGDQYTYKNWDCRCGPCREVAASARRARRQPAVIFIDDEREEL